MRIENTSQSSKYTEEQRAQIIELSSGDRLYFEHIFVRGPSGESKQIKSMVYYIK